MYSLLFIAKNNLKKKKGDVAVLFFLIALATFLLYASVSVLSGIGNVLDTAYEKANTADFLFMSNVDKKKEIEEYFLSREEVTEYETSECFYQDAKYRKSQKEEKSDFAFVINVIEEERTISKLTDMDEKKISYASVLLPYYLMLSGQYEVGDSFFLTLGEEEYEFKVAGYTEDPLVASPLGVSLYSIYITDAYMKDILAKNSFVAESVYYQYRMRLKEGENTADFDDSVMTELTKEIPELANANNLSLNRAVMQGSSGIMPNISMSIILIFSILLVLIALIIIRFSIHNFMELNLKNIGILQAIGYTVRQLKFVSVLEMGVIGLFGIVIGIVFGILGSDAIGNIQGRLIGITWNQGFQPGIAVLIACISFVTIIVTTGMISAIYGKVSVLDALREGIRAHNFRKNHFSFEKSCLPKSMVLAGKNLLGEKMKNISILCIIIVLSFATCMGFVLYQNFAENTDYLMKVVGMEGGDIAVTGDMQKLETIGEELEDWKEVEKVLYYDNCTVELSSGEKKRTVICDIWKNPELNENELLIRGRLPKYDNEIVLTAGVAKALGADIGDIIYAEARNGKKDYIITGIDQKMSQMGMKSLITKEGAKRLNGSTQIFVLYVHTIEGVTFTDIEDKIKEKFPELEIENSKEVIDEALSSVVVGMTLICIVFVFATFLVVIMVETLLVRSKTIKERKNYGISKALGYTTRQLMVEMMMMNMPVVVSGAILGAVFCLFLANPLATACLSSFGIEKCDLSISPEWLLLTVVGIVLVAAVVSFLSAVRTRKIEPVKMLTEE